jgi:acyl dehydratase
MLLGAPGLDMVRDRMAPPVGMGVLHESQVFRRVRPLPIAEALVVTGKEEGRGDSRSFVFALEGPEGAIGDMETRLRFVTPDIMAALKGAELRPAMKTPDMTWVETAPISDERVETYLALSHDPNPIHRDDSAARAVGLSRAVVPGMLIAGLCEAALDAAGGKADEIRTRYLAPLPGGASLRLGVQVKETGPNMRARVFAITTEDRIVAISDTSRDSCL